MTTTSLGTSRLCNKCTLGGKIDPSGRTLDSNAFAIGTCPFPVVHLKRLCLGCMRTYTRCDKALSTSTARCFGTVQRGTNLPALTRAFNGPANSTLVGVMHHREVGRLVFRKR